MVDDNPRRGSSVNPLWTWTFGIAVFACCFLWFRSFYPPPSNDTFIALFFLLSAVLAIGFFGVGDFVCNRVFRVHGSGMEIPVGIGLLALVLTFYLRVSLHPIIPVSLLLLGAFHSARLVFLSGTALRAQLNQHTTAIFVTVCAIIMTTLSFPTLGDGFLLFPNDFDSNLIHVTAPRIVVERGVFFNPDWLRGLWLPQLTMALYTCILSFSNPFFLKTLNVVCFIQFALLFARCSSSATGRAASIAWFALVTTLPEFRQYVVQTNLDTIFALFSVSAFFLLINYLKSPDRNSLLLLGFICGLSAGQKHFGLLYSVPVMSAAALMYLLKSNGVRDMVQKALPIAAAGSIFSATFSCFYLHNLLSGNSLLFPFIGTKLNTYGWDDVDLTQMIESTIPHWGYSKTLAGYFLLPLHFLQHPDKYQFKIFGTWADLGMSVALGALYVFTVVALIVKPLRRAAILLPCLVLCADVALWYRGSQVIRYLYPVLISSALAGALLLTKGLTRVCRSSRSQRIATSSAIILAAAASAIWITPPKTPLAQSDEEARSWLTTYRGVQTDAFRWLTEHAPSDNGILNLAGHDAMAHFPKLTLCGDWFGRCRYSRFISGYITFRPWPELKTTLKANHLSYIVVNWNTFAPHSKLPTSSEEWSTAIPESTRNCLEHVYHDGISTDVYKVKDSCLL